MATRGKQTDDSSGMAQEGPRNENDEAAAIAAYAASLAAKGGGTSFRSGDAARDIE